MRFVILTYLLFASSILIGQDYVELFNAQYQNTHKNNFINSTASTRIEQANAEIMLPIVLSQKLAIISGFSFYNTKLQYMPHSKNINLIGYELKAGVNIKHNKKWTGTYLFMPKWVSSAPKMDVNNLQLGGGAMLKYKKNKNLKYIVGAYYNNQFYGPFTTPLLGFYYKKKKLEASVLLPAVTDLNYSIGKNTTLGFYYRAIARSYNITPGVIQPQNEYIMQTSNEVSLYLGKELFKAVLIKAHIGHSIARSYRIYDAQDKIDLNFIALQLGDHRKQLNQDSKNGFFLRLGMTYKFYLKDQNSNHNSEKN